MWEWAAPPPSQGLDYRRLIHEIELEKEETKFYKKKTQRKL